MWGRFEPCLGTFTLLFLDVYPVVPLKLVFLDFYLTTFSEYVISEIKKLWGSLFFSKYSKFNLDLKNAAKNSEKVFWYLDNCIWIGIVKLSPLRTGYFSSAANLLKRSRRFCVSIRETFSNYIDLEVINHYDQGAMMQISTVLGYVSHVDCRRVLSNSTF